MKGIDEKIDKKIAILRHSVKLFFLRTLVIIAVVTFGTVVYVTDYVDSEIIKVK